MCNGWIDKKAKKVGKSLVFGSLRDVDGQTIQLVDANSPSVVRSLKQESAVSIEGKLEARTTPDGGRAWDLVVSNATVLNEASVVGSQLQTGHTKEWPPQYRYLQLRGPQFQANLKRRAKIMRVCRDVLDKLGFTEIETPLLFKSTPEGAREFLVPTRKKGLMYALPQSPQQYKQLLMASGIHKYYQIARCFRDEDLRADRQPEFTQLDMEMSFSNGGDVRTVVENVVKTVWADVASKDLLTFDPATKTKLVKADNLTHLTYDEAISRFGIDKPDIRSSLEIVDTTGYARAVDHEGFDVFEILVIRNGMNESPGLAKKLADPLHYKARVPRVVALKSESALAGWSEKFSGLAEFDDLAGLQKKLELKVGDIIAGSTRRVKNYENPTPLGRLRTVAIQETLPLGKYQRETDVPESLVDEFAAIWVTEFPLFNPVEVDQPADAKYPEYDTTQYVSTHHPFTMANTADYDKLVTEPLEVRGQHYDLVLNGVELGGGSTRVHDTALQRYIFDNILRIDNSHALFGHLLEAFDTGCPPHAGLAIGFDRMTAMLSATESIRDVIAFPKSITGADLMIGSPSVSTESQLRPYFIKVID